MEYQQMYALLFNAVTDALAQLDRQNYGTALLRTPKGAENRKSHSHINWL